MKVITVATHSERYYPVLVQSCKRHNVDLVTLGWGQKWKGFTWRFELLLEYLKSLDPNELVVFIDAYDVVVLQDAEVIEKRFHELQGKTEAKLIVGWERAKSPLIEGLSLLIFRKCKGTRLNMGTYMGYCKDIYAILKDVCSMYNCKDVKDDQVLFTKYCGVKPSRIHIDTGLDLFFVINGALKHLDMQRDGISIVNGSVHINGGKTPCFFHGIGATNMNEIIEKLGYDNPYPIGLKEIFDYDVKSVVHFYQYMYLLIVVIAILCIGLFVWAYYDQKNK